MFQGSFHKISHGAEKLPLNIVDKRGHTNGSNCIDSIESYEACQVFQFQRNGRHYILGSRNRSDLASFGREDFLQVSNVEYQSLQLDSVTKILHDG